jgi:hypothetical protein
MQHQTPRSNKERECAVLIRKVKIIISTLKQRERESGFDKKGKHNNLCVKGNTQTKQQQQLTAKQAKRLMSNTPNGAC